VAVLKVNFKHHGNSAEKIEKGEFAIEDVATRRDIDLNTNWELCFSPGQRVEMSMVVKTYGAYRDNFDRVQTSIRLIPDPDSYWSTLPVKPKFEKDERKEFAIYQDVRFRFDDRLRFASAERRYGQPWAKLEKRKCKFCPQCFWTSEDRRIHESVRMCYLSHFYLGVLLRSCTSPRFRNASWIPSIKRGGLEMLISRYR
jgi:hypothetical protein